MLKKEIPKSDSNMNKEWVMRWRGYMVLSDVSGVCFCSGHL